MYILVILFGVDKETLGTILYAIPKYTWAFIPISFNVLVSSYLYSVKKAKESTINKLCKRIYCVADCIAIFTKIIRKDAYYWLSSRCYIYESSYNWIFSDLILQIIMIML